MTPGAVIGLSSVAGATWAFYYAVVRPGVRITAAKRPYDKDAKDSLKSEVRAQVVKVGVCLGLHLLLSVVMWVASVRVLTGLEFDAGWDPTAVAVVVVGGLCLLQTLAFGSDVRTLQAARRHAMMKRTGQASSR